MSDEISDVIGALDSHFDRTVSALVEFARIPGVSAAGFDPRRVEESADHAAGLCAAAGFENVEVLRLPDVHPYVVGDWLRAGPDAPTILVYAHHDVQPPGRAAFWQTPAFEPTVRSDGRLYGRGVVDDKAGLMLNLAAIRAWLDARGALPVNVKLVVEGEEEIGSPNLFRFLSAHRERLMSDVIVLSDTANLATGLPSLTTSLRGLVSIDVTVRALDHPLHSGMWGGPVMDAASALARILARLVDDAGRVTVPGIEDDLPSLDAATRARLAALPFEVDGFRSDAGMPKSARLTGDAAASVYEKLWLRPSIAVTAIDAVPLAQASNQLVDCVRARVGVRVAPGQDPDRLARVVVREIERDPPWGVVVETELDTAVPGWRTEPAHPAFERACRAMRAGYGRDAVFIGCGGTIPFVGPFSEVMGDAPALLLGLEDPPCNAHGENESLNLEDFAKASRAAAYLLAELGEL